MHPLGAVAVVGAMLCAPLEAALTERGAETLHSDVGGTAEIAGFFGDSVAIMDIDEDNILDCLTARRTQFDPQEWSATYLWSVQGSTGERLQFSLHAWAAETPDSFYFTTGLSPGQVYEGRTHYFDHESCVVATMNHRVKQCTLWVTKERMHSIPDECLENYEDICGTGVDLHAKDVCKDVDQSAFL